MQESPTRIVAHRGASDDAPENTVPAFTLAWEQGADAIECDVRLTKDGRIVCLHDPDTERVAGKALRPEDATLDDLRALDVGAWRGPEWTGARIPTIAEALATVPDGKQICIEIKCGAEILPKLLQRIAESKLANEQIVIITFKTEVIQALKARAPELKAYWLSDIKEDESGALAPSVETVLDTLKRTRAAGLDANHKRIGESFIRRVLDAGYECHVWTVDDPATAQRFAQWGVASITTNVPGVIKRDLA